MSTEDGSMDLTDCQIESLYAFSCMPSSVKDQTALECMRLALVGGSGGMYEMCTGRWEWWNVRGLHW